MGGRGVGACGVSYCVCHITSRLLEVGFPTMILLDAFICITFSVHVA